MMEGLNVDDLRADDGMIRNIEGGEREGKKCSGRQIGIFMYSVPMSSSRIMCGSGTFAGQVRMIA